MAVVTLICLDSGMADEPLSRPGSREASLYLTVPDITRNEPLPAKITT